MAGEEEVVRNDREDDVKRWTGMSVVLCARVAVDRCELRRRVKSAVCFDDREDAGVT